MRNQVGDTIVEVLITITVISMVVVGAYISTNKNVASTQDAQERTQAVKLAETQVEYLRNAGTIASGNCFNSSGEQLFAGAQGTNPCIVASDGGQPGLKEQPAYTLQVKTTAKPGVYVITVVWDGVTGHGLQNVTVYYQP